MDDLFMNQGSFNEDISAWDTSGVTMMARMFYEASSFNQPLSGWQVDKVTNMNQMFGGASAFDQDLGWCVGDDVNQVGALDNAPCEATSCGVRQRTCGPTAPPPARSPNASDPDNPHARWGAAARGAAVSAASSARRAAK